MILLDTNIFIYLANGTLGLKKLKDDDLAFASITKVEALGYAQITVAEQSYLEELLKECEQLDLNENVMQQAIRLRQQTRMSLGDAIIAATALAYDCEIWTANTEDFTHIDGLRIHNPLSH